MGIDLNCDMGESFGAWRVGDDEKIMPQITSANIACGYHAGDPLVMARTVDLARKHQVASAPWTERRSNSMPTPCAFTATRRVPGSWRGPVARY